MNLKLISIHIPKTAGTSFYHVLSQIYTNLSPSYKRKQIEQLLLSDKELSALSDFEVIHGHFTYSEIRDLHEKSGAKVITWVRNPVERVMSNYKFFMQGLSDPMRNPQQYELNKHRKNESLLDYARKEENRNRVSKILRGCRPETLDAVGVFERFDESIAELSKAFDWPEIEVRKMNVSNRKLSLERRTMKQIEEWNTEDLEMYLTIVNAPK